MVPLGQERIEADFHVAFDFLSALESGSVALIENVHRHMQAGMGGRFFHQSFDDLGGLEDYALAVPGHMRKQAVFDGVMRRPYFALLPTLSKHLLYFFACGRKNRGDRI